MRLSEHKRRRREFVGGMPVMLPDGQVWHFYEPRLAELGAAYPWDFGPLPSEVTASLNETLGKLSRRLKDAATDEERIASVIMMAWFCLARNYVIFPTQFAKIVQPVNAGLWGRLERLIEKMGWQVERGASSPFA